MSTSSTIKSDIETSSQYFSKPQLKPTELVPFPSTKAKLDPVKTMKSLQWFGNKDVRVIETPQPLVTDPMDAVIRVTLSTVCGSDLHLYHNEFSGMEKGDILGHEFCGIVEQVGPLVKNLVPGDRVVVSAIIACGKCEYCLQEKFSCCDRTNNSKEMEALYGHHIAGVFGYSHLLGGYSGGQAEYVRVPLADVNCLKITSPLLTDEQVLFLSDIVCTGYHGVVLGEVEPGKTVCIWGAGPVGLMAAAWSKFKGAQRVIVIDCLDYRLQLAKKKLGCDIVNFSQVDTLVALKEIAPEGIDVAIDCVGFRFPKSLMHKIERALRLETDAPSVITECIMAVKKGGNVSIIGDYYAYTNNFPIGALMEKSITLRGGQVFVQKYWNELLSHIEKGEFDPTFVITHRLPLEQADSAYQMFDLKQDNVVKLVLIPRARQSIL